MTDRFWKRKSLGEMNHSEWESLCDGCALCCLRKIEDKVSGEVYFTDIACRLLDLKSCRCIDYPARVRQVVDCLVLSADEPETFRWLPKSCAYRRLSEGKELPDWHPLITGNPDSVHETDISVRGKARSEIESTEYSILRKLA